MSEGLAETYLGDGLYAQYDGFQFKLFTPQGHEVFLEDEVLASFLRFVCQTKKVKITVGGVEV